MKEKVFWRIKRPGTGFTSGRRGKEKALIVALLFLCFSIVAPSHAQPPLVVNGGFETGDFTGWTLYSSSDENPFVVHPDLAHTPSAYGAERGMDWGFPAKLPGAN